MIADKKSFLIFNGGISTEPEVNELFEKFGIPIAGQQFSYREIETVLRISRTATRWKSVVGAWRKRLFRQHNILLKAIPNEGFQAMGNSERVTFSSGLFKGGLKRLSQAATVASSTDRTGLSDEEKAAADHIQKTGANLRLAAQTAARQLVYPELDKPGNGAEHS